MNIVKTRRFTLRVHPAGLALAAIATVMGYGVHTGLAVAALLIHEGFHAAAMGILGVRILRIELTPFGGVADVESFQSLPASWQILISLAGVLGSLFCYFLLGFVNAEGSQWEPFRQMNLILGLFNLLPILPLDGARALGAATDHFAWGHIVRKGMMGFAFGVALLMLAAAVYGAWHGHINVTLLFVAPYLCYAARQAHVTERVRFTEERLRMSAKLRKGKVWKVEGIAMGSGMSKHGLLKILLSSRGNRLHYFFLLDPETGKVQKVLEEREAIDAILSESQELPYLHSVK
jgi:stage IV sporulation protein FB